MDRRAFLAASTGVAVGLAGCLGAAEGESDYDIGMSASAFLPEDDFEPRVGEPVVWRNTGMRAHTVTAYGSGIPDDAAFFASGGFETTAEARRAWNRNGGGAINGGETYEHTFEVPGTYNYFCIPHEPGGMVGSFEVVE
ncbi:plastocyanin/azurin family copper-binding protein [Halococcus hamelinensis]|jgi:plastocyanin|uniref:Halocyanin hcpH n=1 Tax=Halococcus hamelinensis 100A6 TaxID=1132509 RepID=M0M9U4_9EURY|nr:plastocyanin/azurin family copper-binding protein [Halococcus hamelinensis]EMA41409.1 halocyanin hcpH [Halococcus hamelinensis 100A6]